MIVSTDIFPIGTIVKMHGSKRELLFQCHSDILNHDEIEYIVLDVQGIYVPFFIESIRFFTADSGVLILENVDTENKKKALIGCSMFLSNDYLHFQSDEIATTEQLLDFNVYNIKEELIGTIKSIDTTTENPLFVVKNNEREYYIPIVDEFFVSIEEEQQKIILNLPEGLLDIN